MCEQQKTSGLPNQPLIITPDPAVITLRIPSVTIWKSYHFAPEWFADAMHEAQTGTNHHACRREIIFAVCCAESYLLEWVRDEVLNRDFHRLAEFFPHEDKTGVTEKWKRVPKKLFEKALIPAPPDFGNKYWENWLKLVDLRNGLVHASSSRPESDSLPSKEQPRPSKSDLDQLGGGWALNVVIELIHELHRAAGTTPPTWLTIQ